MDEKEAEARPVMGTIFLVRVPKARTSGEEAPIDIVCKHFCSRIVEKSRVLFR